MGMFWIWRQGIEQPTWLELWPHEGFANGKALEIQGPGQN
jgi:hypothetical protein